IERANPSKGGDAKLRVYPPAFGARPPSRRTRHRLRGARADRRIGRRDRLAMRATRTLIHLPPRGRFALAALLVFSLVALLAPAVPAAATGTTYYVDCTAGADTNAGTRPTSAWKSLAKANAASLAPGDALLLMRGCTWSGPLTAKWSGTATAPITIGAYGSGSLPRIKNADPQGNVVKVTGTYQVLDSLSATADPPPADPNCQNQPVGWRVGFAFAGGSYNTLQNSEAFGLTAGVQLSGATSHNAVLHNALHDNTNMSVNTNNGGYDDSGAWGLLVNGDANEIAWNTFANNNAWCSYDFGTEGASIELYKAQGNAVHHNVSTNDATFSELGGDSTRASSGNTFAYNQFADTVHSHSEFLNLRGPNNVAVNNSTYQTGSSSLAFTVDTTSGTVARNNVFWANGNVAWAPGAFAESGNVYWSASGAPNVNFSGAPLSPSSRKANPKYVNAGAL